MDRERYPGSSVSEQDGRFDDVSQYSRQLFGAFVHSFFPVSCASCARMALRVSWIPVTEVIFTTTLGYRGQ